MHRRPMVWTRQTAPQILALAFVLAFAAAASAVAAPDPVFAAAFEERTNLEDSVLTLFSAVERALEQFPSVGASRAERDAARARSKAAAATLYPWLRLSSAATRYEEPALVTPFHGLAPGVLPSFNRTVVQSSLSASLTLFDGGARIGRYRSAREGARAVEAALTATEQALVTQTLSAYLAVLGARELLGAHDQRIEALSAELARVRQMLETGKAARVDLLRVEAALASAEADRVRTSAAYDDAERDLARLTGLDPASTRAASLAGVALADTAVDARSPWTARALAASPAIREAKSRAKAARMTHDAAKGARFPTLDLVGNYVDWRDPDGTSALEWNAGLRVGISLFTGGAIGQEIAGARAAAEGAAALERVAVFQVGRGVDHAYSAVLAARARAASLERAVDRFAEVARIERLLLESGRGTQTDYLIGQADLLAARASAIDATNAEIEARADLARVAGILTLEWLKGQLETE